MRSHDYNDDGDKNGKKKKKKEKEPKEPMVGPITLVISISFCYQFQKQ